MFEEVEKKPEASEEVPEVEFHVMPQVRPKPKPEKKAAPPTKPSPKKYYIILALAILLVLGGIIGGISIWYKLKVLGPVTLENKELCQPNWQCSDWSICLAGKQSRICQDLSNCGTEEAKPTEERTCKEPSKPPPQKVIEEDILLGVTLSSDKDKDGLSDLEEGIYQTEILEPDTDNDTYPDGLEIVNIYSPLSGPGDRLAVSGLVDVYINPVYRWSIFYPIHWQIVEQTDKVSVDPGTGELINILVKDNPEELSASGWFLAEYPEIDSSQLKASLLTAEDSVWNLNRQSLYISKGDKVYIISYDFGDLKELSFKSTFAMIIRSFKILR